MTRRKPSRPSTSAKPVPNRGLRLAAGSAFVPPYAPSLINRIIDWLDRGRFPAWAFLLVVAVLLFLGLTLVEWHEGAYPAGTFRALHALIGAGVPFLIWLVRYLDRSAGNALREFSPALRDGADSYSLRYQLTTLPRTPTLVVGGAAVLIIGVMAWLFVGDLRLFEIAATPLSEAVFGVILVVTWWITGVFVYHFVRQLVLIYHIFTRQTRIDFFRLTPLYAFSHHTRRAAIAVLLFVYVDYLAADPTIRLHPMNLGAGGLLTLLAIVAFVGPLAGAHRLLVAEKTRLLDDNAHRLEAGFHELQRRMDSLRLSGADDLNKTLSSLEIERTALHRIPTWPWEPGTIRGMVTAFILPVALWLTTFALQRMLE